MLESALNHISKRGPWSKYAFMFPEMYLVLKSLCVILRRRYVLPNTVDSVVDHLIACNDISMKPYSKGSFTINN